MESLLDLTRIILEDREEGRNGRLVLAAHIATALATKSGTALKAWLREACYMDWPMTGEEIESAAQTQRIGARRDLFIALENLEKEGAQYVADNRK
ncbi:MAG: hypothetical protein LBQ10_12030 [Desulfovibrio sp.]|jgi:hypothetical protein|nr:hypothetical protein [Desulfovibrio sp.]